MSHLLIGIAAQNNTILARESVSVRNHPGMHSDCILLCCHCSVASFAWHHAQVWLQRFAWTEQKLASRIEKRNALPKDPILLRDEPMFCFETAVKLLYWAGFVYEHEEVRHLDTQRHKTPHCVDCDSNVVLVSKVLLFFAAQVNFLSSSRSCGI